MTSTASNSSSSNRHHQASSRPGRNNRSSFNSNPNSISPIDVLARNHPLFQPTFAPDLSQFNLINQETGQNTGLFQQPYRDDNPSNDTLGAQVRQILGPSFSPSNSSTPPPQVQQQQQRHGLNPSPVPRPNMKSITPPLQAPQMPPKTRPSSVNNNQTSPPSKLKPNAQYKISNLDSYDLTLIFEVNFSFVSKIIGKTFLN